jgi:ribosomal protein L13E
VVVQRGRDARPWVYHGISVDHRRKKRITGEVDFGFSWQNSYGQDVMINTQTLADASGF